MEQLTKLDIFIIKNILLKERNNKQKELAEAERKKTTLDSIRETARAKAELEQITSILNKLN